MTGRIVILNGAPRSGKSTLARAFQAANSDPWIVWGVDAFNATLPPALMPGIGLRPGGERPDFEPLVGQLYGAFFAHMARLARENFDVVADLGMHRAYVTGLDPLALMVSALSGLKPIMIGVDCAVEAIMARRNADPQGGFYVSGQGVPEPVQRWQVAVHQDMDYALRLDMGAMPPEQGAALIKQRLHEIA